MNFIAICLCVWWVKHLCFFTSFIHGQAVAMLDSSQKKFSLLLITIKLSYSKILGNNSNCNRNQQQLPCFISFEKSPMHRFIQHKWKELAELLVSVSRMSRSVVQTCLFYLPSLGLSLVRCLVLSQNIIFLQVDLTPVSDFHGIFIYQTEMLSKAIKYETKRKKYKV